MQASFVRAATAASNIPTRPAMYRSLISCRSRRIVREQRQLLARSHDPAFLPSRMIALFTLLLRLRLGGAVAAGLQRKCLLGRPVTKDSASVPIRADSNVTTERLGGSSRACSLRDRSPRHNCPHTSRVGRSTPEKATTRRVVYPLRVARNERHHRWTESDGDSKYTARNGVTHSLSDVG